MTASPPASTTSPFSAEERAAFARDDRQATAAIFVLAVSVFLMGIVIYTIVLVACL